MHYCRRCKNILGCNCELKDGYCFSCYSFLLAEIGEKGIIQELVHECKKLPELQGILNLLKAKEKRNELMGYQIAILNSQIAQYYKNPCAYKEIIEQINAN